jgi:hypothetical protein
MAFMPIEEAEIFLPVSQFAWNTRIDIGSPGALIFSDAYEEVRGRDIVSSPLEGPLGYLK